MPIITDPFTSSVGQVMVVTTTDGGRPPEYFAERIMASLMFIGDQAPQPIRDQAFAFRDRMHAVILDGIKQAIESDRVYRK
jgi:hypothetical protein